MTQSGVCASRYTGKERDAESGLDYFGARYYASTMGRFLSPDWSANHSAVPYANFQNPQSLNLYSYVSNNPLTRTDLDGHFWKELKNKLLYGYWTRDTDGARNQSELDQHSDYMATTVIRNAQQMQEQRFVVTSRVIAGFMMGMGEAEEGSITVIGHAPEYVNLGEELNANYFSVPDAEWEALSPSEQWSKNHQFLDKAIERGDRFRLATSLDKVRPGSFYEKEVEYLPSKGYQLSPSGTELVAPPVAID